MKYLLSSALAFLIGLCVFLVHSWGDSEIPQSPRMEGVASSSPVREPPPIFEDTAPEIYRLEIDGALVYEGTVPPDQVKGPPLPDRRPVPSDMVPTMLEWEADIIPLSIEYAELATPDEQRSASGWPRLEVVNERFAMGYKVEGVVGDDPPLVEEYIYNARVIAYFGWQSRYAFDRSVTREVMGSSYVNELLTRNEEIMRELRVAGVNVAARVINLSHFTLHERENQ